MFVKLGYDWEVFSNENYMWLGNCLTGKLFEIVDDDKKQIINMIKKGTSEKELNTMFLGKWETFKDELEKNYVIIYSSSDNVFRDSMVRGGTLVETSHYIKRKAEITRVAIQVNSHCEKNCDFCNVDNEFSCMSCYSDMKDREIDINIIKKFINDINNIVVREVLLTGGNLNFSFKKVKDIVEVFNKRNIIPKIYMITNSSIDGEKLEYIKKKKIILVVNIVSSNNIYIREMENFINCLNQYGIRYIVHNRIVDFQNNVNKNRTIEEIVRNKENIVNGHNIGRTCSIDVNTAVGIKNLCNYGKIMIDITGDMKICNEYNKIFGNVKKDNCIEIIEKLSEEWNDNTIKRCESCGLQKICTACSGVLRKYEDYEQICQFNAL